MEVQQSLSRTNGGDTLSTEPCLPRADRSHSIVPVPVVDSTVGHPDREEVRESCQYYCGLPCCAGYIVLAMLVLFMSHVYTAHKPGVAPPECTPISFAPERPWHAPPNNSDVAPRHCAELATALERGDVSRTGLELLAAPQTVHLTCNRCSTAYNRECEVSEPAASSKCARGTDTFDCELERQEAAYLTYGQQTMDETRRSLNLVGDIFFAFFNMVTIFCFSFCCVGWLRGGWKGYGCCRLQVLPVGFDMVYEILRSRYLAIVEATSLFLLLIAAVFEVRLCKSAFAIVPQIAEVEPKAWNQKGYDPELSDL
eukprot:SAG11_NODE_2403_length_3399_cov_2.326364_1_plen_311_part_10